MLEVVQERYAYWCIVVLLVIGLYGMLMKRNLLKKVIGMTIFQTAIILFFIVIAYKSGATVPIMESGHGGKGGADEVVAEDYINPLPHTLMLTAIVVGVATVGVALALLVLVYRHFGTLDEPTLLERMR